jgi:hypothetical protein
VRGELQDSTLTVGTSRNDTDVGWVVDSCDNSSCEDDLLPRENMSVCNVFCAKISLDSRNARTRSCQC